MVKGGATDAYGSGCVPMDSPLLDLWTYAEFAACAFAFLPIMAAARLTEGDDPTHRGPGRWMRRFGRTTSRLTPAWQFSIEGQPPADIHRRGYVVVANHESVADPFLLSWLPWDMRWIGKEELFKVPVTGWMLKLSGDIAIRRGDRDSVVDMMDECARTLSAGLSVMIFPEGTRSSKGDLLPFKDGAFQLAARTGAPILPVALAGTRACRRKGSWRIGRAHAIARVLSPIEVVGATEADVPRLREAARAQIAAALPEVRARIDGHVLVPPVRAAA
jgi:1-acyl-sn-glycerol-3-phosphate acyltransferase